MMNITVNNNVMAITPGASIEDLLKSAGKPLTGSAIAVNQKVISRSQWGEYKICEGDEISLFQAIAGG